MVEEPMSAVGKHSLRCELVEYAEEVVDRLAVAGVEAKAPIIAGEDPDSLLNVVKGGAR